MPKNRPSDNGQVYHFSLRWSVPDTPENKKILHEQLRYDPEVDKYIFQAEMTINEEGKENPHYQCYFHRKKKQRPKKLAIDWNDEMKGVNIQAASTKGKEALKAYCMKEESRVRGPWADKRLYLGRDLWKRENFPNWQKDMLKYLEAPPNDRDMYWVYDPIGHNGKTKFIKWLTTHLDGVFLGWAAAENALNLVSQFPHKMIYAWNLTRTKPKSVSELDLYTAMESVKDGMFMNTKYETKMILMEPPHIIVCSNDLPKLHLMSLDRWKIFQVVEGELITWRSNTRHTDVPDYTKSPGKKRKREVKPEEVVNPFPTFFP